MMNKVYIKVNTNMKSFIKYLTLYKIDFDNLEVHDNCYYLYTSYDNYKRIRRRYDCTILKYYGKKGLYYFFNKYKYMFVSLIWGIILISILQNTIFDVVINTDDDNLYETISNSLRKYDILKYKKKKSFEEISFIKEKILEENKDDLEWIEIKEIGCKYEIMITKRVKGKENNLNDNICHIVAKKDGLIKHITSSKGEKLKAINDYVKKGDIIISGNIIKGEDTIKNKVCASGNVYGEVWYTVNISVPYNFTEYINTGKIINHYYLDIFGKEFTIIGKYDSNNVMSNKKLIIDKPYLFFKLYKEEKSIYEYKSYKLSKEEAYNEAIKRADAKIKNKLLSDEYIISKKVLKKEEFSSKIVLEIFFKVYENIGEVLVVEEELYDEGNSNRGT